jgi:hypothetical protein
MLGHADARGVEVGAAEVGAEREEVKEVATGRLEIMKVPERVAT